MVINLRQNKNDDSTAYGKFFAEVDSKVTIPNKTYFETARISLPLQSQIVLLCLV